MVAEATRLALAFGRKLGTLTLGNVTTVFALSALAFYVVGLFRRMAQLHDVGVPIGRGVPLSPLQDYLVNGLAVIANPYNLYTLFWVALVGAVILGLPTGAAVLTRSRGNGGVDKPSSPPPEQGSTELSAPPADQPDAVHPTRRARVLGYLVLAIILGFPIGALLLIPAATWFPFAAVLIIVVALLLLNIRYAAVPLLAPGRWSTLHAGVVAGMFLVTLGRLAALVVWFKPPPLDHVTVRRGHGEAVSGPLLAQANGVVYVAGGRQNGDKADIVAVPLGRISSIRISDGISPDRKTIPELVGIRFWRAVQESDGGWHLERSPP